ncbi:MAG: hypothetical protein Q4G24_10730 [Paracoccus sp. (in: a-proteobacteria)]|uniref:hypothetical protein n=1 Tax=Paracoccus sp. TaxID=267 RepID=UPI0026DF2459|nr:hypothetical protein [Paracoccus sp. (in: a-proteobacteria)]MDO5621933.1 hypothetical protein [Paracoccus sp. (in: a-proteobacteria)]
MSGQVALLDDAVAAVAIWNDAAGRCGWPRVVVLNGPRRAQVMARMRECGGLDGWRAAVERAEASDFLSGRRGGGGWFAFDWLVKSANFIKVMEGNYDNRGRIRPGAADRHADALRNRVHVAARARPAPREALF